MLLLTLACLVSACDTSGRASNPASTPAPERTRSVPAERPQLGQRFAVPVEPTDAWRGASVPLVTMVVFLDYGASETKRVAADIETLLSLHGDRLRVVLKPYTRASEPAHRYPARAVLAAGRQGLGWLMHGRLFEQDDGIERSKAMQHAVDIGVSDLAAFGRDVDDQAPLDRNLALARNFGVNASAFVFVNGAVYSKLDGLAGLLDAYRAELALAEQLVAAGQPASELYRVFIDGAASKRAADIELAPPFDGPAIATTSLASGVEIELVREGEGEPITDGSVASMRFTGYASTDGRAVMGSRGEPSKVVVMEHDDVIAGAVVDSLRGQRVGSVLRVKIPAAAIPADDPSADRIAAVGDLLLAIEIVDRSDRPLLAGLDAFSGKPRKTKIHEDGLEIHDYRAGQGRAAKAGDQVTVHYIGHLEDGTEFDTSHDRAEGLTATADGPGTIKGFSRGLVGCRVGMLRKIVFPPELGYGDIERGKIPASSPLTFYIEVMDVTEAKDEPSDDSPEP